MVIGLVASESSFVQTRRKRYRQRAIMRIRSPKAAATAIVRVKPEWKTNDTRPTCSIEERIILNNRNNRYCEYANVVSDAVSISDFHRSSPLAIISAPFSSYLGHPNFQSFIQSFFHPWLCLYIYLFVSVTYKHSSRICQPAWCQRGTLTNEDCAFRRWLYLRNANNE